MRRPVTLLAAALVILGEAGGFGYLAAASLWAMTHASCRNQGGIDPCQPTAQVYALFAAILFVAVACLLLAFAVLLTVRPIANTWIYALLPQCLFLDLFSLLAVGLLLTDASKHGLVTDLWSLLQLFWLWAPPSAAMVLLLVPSSLGACFPPDGPRRRGTSGRTPRGHTPVTHAPAECPP